MALECLGSSWELLASGTGGGVNVNSLCPFHFYLLHLINSFPMSMTMTGHEQGCLLKTTSLIIVKYLFTFTTTIGETAHF